MCRAVDTVLIDQESIYAPLRPINCCCKSTGEQSADAGTIGDALFGPAVPVAHELEIMNDCKGSEHAFGRTNSPLLYH
jgi:hypothetical protein